MLTTYIWIQAHPVFSWGIASAIISLVYTKLEAYPKAHAVLTFLAGWGIDLPTILKAVKKFIGGPPIAPAAMLLVGCAAAAPIANAGLCIAADVIQGKTLEQIAADCGVTVEQAAVAVLESTDPQVINSPAHAEATHLKQALVK